MTNLEFIEEKIKNIKFSLERLKSHDLNDPYLKHLFEENNKDLNILEQIKTIIEAWEVVKNKSVDIHNVIHCSSLEVFNCDLYKKYQLTEEEYNKIKKALEVEDA